MMSLIKPGRPHDYDYVESTLGNGDKLELDESKDRKSGNARKCLRRRGIKIARVVVRYEYRPDQGR